MWRVTTKQLGFLTAFLVFDSALLLAVGATMWEDPPSPADEAVGKGLVTLAAALGVPAFVLVCAWLNAHGFGPGADGPVRSDWDEA
jgi:hypothetical protein